MKKRFVVLLITFVLAWIILLLSFVIPIAFSGIYVGEMSTIWLFISNTGGVVGVPIITLLFCIFLAYQFKGWRKKMISVTISFVSFAILLGGFAKLNENIIKTQIKAPRPYTAFLEYEKNFNVNEFYSIKEKEQRQIYLKEFLENDYTSDTKKIAPSILYHWIEETGYSFPSGHTINSFLMAFIMGYVLLYLYQDYKRKYVFVVPFIWAVGVALSRVAIGAHSALDITLGALMGTVIGLVVISTGVVDKLLKQKI